MKLAIFIIFIILITINYTCNCDEDIHWKSEDEYSNYQIENIHKITDWDCWYKDYFLKVSRCHSKTLKSKEKINCKQYRGCKRYCTSVYGIEQCRVRCRLKNANISKFIKVVYRVRQDGNCKDSVICVYRSKCHGLWPKYIHQGCYYTRSFSVWWLKHKKEYAKPRISSRSMIRPAGKIYNCLINNGKSPLINPLLETTIKFRMSHSKIYYKVGQLWIRAKFVNENLFYWIGRMWVPVKFSRRHQYLKIGDEWFQIVVLRKTIYCYIQNVWVPLKISFGKEYIKLGKRWLRLKISNGKVNYKFGGTWVEIKILQNDLYNKINEIWYKVKFTRHINLIKIGGGYRKIKSLYGIKYIKLGNRWFEFELKKKKYLIKLDNKWNEIEFERRLTFIFINEARYPILFKSFSIYIQINNEWFQIEYQYENLFFKIDKIWLHLLLKENDLYMSKNDKMIKLVMDNKRNLLYKSYSTGKLKSIHEMEMQSGKYFSIEQFVKKENSIKLKLFGGHWLPFKTDKENSFYLLSEKWIKLKLKDEKLFYEDNEQWIEICLIGKTEFNKLQGHWIEVKREKDKFYFFDSNLWHQIKLTGRHLALKIKNSWKSFAFVNGRKFIRLGNKFSEIKFDSSNQTKFYLKMGQKWHKLMIQDNQYYIHLNDVWKRLEFYTHRSTKILFDHVWLSVSFKDKKLYVKNGNCWLETILKDNKIMLKIGDLFNEVKASSNKVFHVNINGKFYKLIEKNEIELNNKTLKITYIDGKLHMFVNDNWLPLKIGKKKTMVKVIDSWIETNMDNKSKHIIVKVNDQKIHLTFENGILCEQYENLKIPISIRFKKLYYNLDDKWVKIYPKDNLRYIKENKNLVRIDSDYLKRKIRKYKLKLMLKCVISSMNKKYKSAIKRPHNNYLLNIEQRQSYFKRNIKNDKIRNMKLHETIDMLKKPKPSEKKEIV